MVKRLFLNTKIIAMENSGIKISNYTVSGDNTLLDKQNHITPEVRNIVEEIHPDVLKGRNYLIKKLNKLCRQYPKVPVFKNLLSAVYQQKGNIQKAREVNHWLVKEHPDYLFGKLNLAAEFLLDEKPEKIPEILGEVMEIGLLYPDRKEFHIEEVLGFNNIVVEYYLQKDKIEQAEERVEIMKELDEDHPKTHSAKNQLQAWYFNKAFMRAEEENQLRKNIEEKDRRSHLQTEKAPDFHFPKEMQWLYENNLSIDRGKIEKILQLDNQLLIEDLKKVLLDSIYRFDFFRNKEEEEGYQDDFFDFPQHALLLLGTLNIEKSLEDILEILKLDNSYKDFWWGDFINDFLEPIIYNAEKTQSEKLFFEFLKLPNINAYNKAVVGENLAKVISFQPEKRTYYIQQYRELLQHCIKYAEDEDLIDTEFLGFVISDITDLGFHELLPEIKQLFELEIVGFWICGHYKDIANDIKKPRNFNLEFTNKDIYARYDELKKYEQENDEDWDDELEEVYDEELLNRFLENDFQQPIEKPAKIGRNDPCPCGSGKKYKKCCLNK